MGNAVLIVFIAALVACIALGLPILTALVLGLVLFCLYAHRVGHAWGDVLRLCLSGVRTVGNILTIFVLIGMLTASWRMCGTIPAIVSWTVPFVGAGAFVPAVFLLNCLMSFLTGTSFGTAATMGVVCMTMSAGLGYDPGLVGGAVLGGAFFGDRCSPMSSSAALVCSLTRTNIFDNVRLMARTALVPFVATCLIYVGLGVAMQPQDLGQIAESTAGPGSGTDVVALFSRAFDLRWQVALPAIVVLVLALVRIDVKIAMIASTACAIAIAYVVQNYDVPTILSCLLTGYACPDPEAAKLLDGGGVASMLQVAAIVCISSSYAGIFEATGLLDGLRHGVEVLSRRTSPFAGALAAAVATSAVSCNQTLSTILTHQLCDAAESNDRTMAIDLEDSVIVVSALIPWSIAASVPLSTIGAPVASIAFAFYLYLQPLWRLMGGGNRGQVGVLLSP